MGKRTIDVALAVFLLVALAPLFLVLAGLVRVGMGRPVLFRQLRPGHDGQPFTIFKFRTMRELRGGESGVHLDDARLTRLGRLLRATSLDELPELWNVMRGDMSLVGPRPLLMEYLERYSLKQARRNDVRPGITGWAQVHGRNLLTWEEKFERDVWYVDHLSFALDLRILAMTFWKVLRREAINASGHATMPEFRGSSND